MKLLYFDDFKLGVLKGDQVVAHMRLLTARLRGADGVAEWNSVVSVTPDPDTTWRL